MKKISKLQSYQQKLLPIVAIIHTRVHGAPYRGVACLFENKCEIKWNCLVQNYAAPQSLEQTSIGAHKKTVVPSLIRNSIECFGLEMFVLLWKYGRIIFCTLPLTEIALFRQSSFCERKKNRYSFNHLLNWFSNQIHI